MAKFNVEFVEMKVPADAKGVLAKFRGKTLHESVQFTPAKNGKHDTMRLTIANPKFAYVAAKLEGGKVHKAYSTSKISKFAKAELMGGGTEKAMAKNTAKVEHAKAVTGVDPELEAAKKLIAERNAQLKAEKAGVSVEDAMLEAEARNEEMNKAVLSDRRRKAIEAELSKYGLSIA